MNFFLYQCLYIVLQFAVGALSYYRIPQSKVKILRPKGFQISIPHEQFIKLVGYNVTVGRSIGLNRHGDYYAEISQPTEGRWVYENREAVVEPDNEINYVIRVRYGNTEYQRMDGLIASAYLEDISEQAHALNPPRTNKFSMPPDCEISLTEVDRKPVCKGELIFEDNFNILNLSIWQKEIRIPIAADDAEFVSFQNKPDNCYIFNGQLRIVPSILSDIAGYDEESIWKGKLDFGAICTAIYDISQECTRQAQFTQILPPVVSARIRTKDSFTFRFGKVEVRAKMPKGDWLFPLILLEPLENYYGFTGYSSGQMRVAFIHGNEVLEDQYGDDISGNRIYGGPVLSIKEGLRSTRLKSSLRGSHLGDDFHIYTLIWTDDSISLQIDGNEYAVIRGGFSQLHQTYNVKHAALWANRHSMAPFDREFFLTLGLSVGGHSDFPDGCLNGIRRERKGWTNRHHTAEFEFWKDHKNWLRSWHDEDVGLYVDYIKVYAL